jgi:uncharacterized protein
MDVIPEEYVYRMNKQAYNVRELAKMILLERKHSRVPKIPHTRKPILPTRQSEILRRAGVVDIIPEMSLFEAASLGRTDIVRQHIRAGTDLNNWFNAQTPLMVASEDGHENVVRLLLNAGADVHVRSRNSSDATALDHAVKGRHLGIMKLLIQHGANVNAKSSQGITTLMGACGYHSRHPDIVKFLIQQGANVYATDRSGHTAMWYAQHSYASDRHRDAIIKVLRDAGL